MLGYKNMYYSFDQGSYHFIALSFEMRADNKTFKKTCAYIPQKYIEWLKLDLSNTDKKVIILTHYGLDEDSLVGNFWFESEPERATINNHQEIRSILEESGKVSAIISAHQHWNKIHVLNKIPYFTVTSLIENFNNDGIPSEAYTAVKLSKEKIIVNVKGNDYAKFEYVFQ